MSKTPDETKKGLECCADVGQCDVACPYGEDWHPLCIIKKSKDALALIQQLQAENAEQAGRIRELEKSLSFARDLADGLKAATVKQEQELYVSEERNRHLQVDLEDMTARLKIADDCAKKKGEMNEKLYAELSAVKAERDAAVADLSGCYASHCPYCKHWDKPGRAVVCINCRNGTPRCKQHFEWRGVTKEE